MTRLRLDLFGWSAPLAASLLAASLLAGCQKPAAKAAVVAAPLTVSIAPVRTQTLRGGVGDFLFARAFELMVETGVLSALEILARASRVIAEGEVLQLTRAHDLNLSQATYLEIITAKTAELFAAAAEAGAVAAGATESLAAALRDYGRNLGLAFQLTDDALDYGGATETLGKNAGDDFREGKATLPLLLAISRSGPREVDFWERAIGRQEQTQDDFRRARELIVGAGALEATLDLASDYAEAAKAALTVFPDGEWRHGLESLADFAVSRRA